MAREYDLQGRRVRLTRAQVDKPGAADRTSPGAGADIDPSQVLARYSPIRMAAFVIFQLGLAALLVVLLLDLSAGGGSLIASIAILGLLIWNGVRVYFISRHIFRAGPVAVWIDGGLVRWEPGRGAFQVEEMTSVNVAGRLMSDVTVSLRSREAERIFALLMVGGATELAMTLGFLIPSDGGWPRRRTPDPSTTPPPPV